MRPSDGVSHGFGTMVATVSDVPSVRAARDGEVQTRQADLAGAIADDDSHRISSGSSCCPAFPAKAVGMRPSPPLLSAL